MFEMLLPLRSNLSSTNPSNKRRSNVFSRLFDRSRVHLPNWSNASALREVNAEPLRFRYSSVRPANVPSRTALMEFPPRSIHRSSGAPLN